MIRFNNNFENNSINKQQNNLFQNKFITRENLNYTTECSKTTQILFLFKKKYRSEVLSSSQ